MDWFRWGQQGSVYGIPISWGLVIQSFLALSSIKNFFKVFFPIPSYVVNIDCVGTVASLSVDGIRRLFVSRILVAFVWGCATLAQVIFLYRYLFLAYVILFLAIVYFCQCAVIYGYALYIKLTGFFLEESLEFRRLNPLLIEWPAFFWVFFSSGVIVTFVLLTMSLDMHWSYIQILKAGGTGWEGKAAHEIHQPERDAVSTLRDTWDSRMGLLEAERPEEV